MLIQNQESKIENSSKGFTLIELMVAILIFSLIVVAIVSVFVSASGAHQKSRAIKTVKENAEYALSSIAKDVRMGKVVKDTRYLSAPRPLADGRREQYLMVTRNSGGSQSGTVCYYITQNLLAKNDKISPLGTGQIGCPSYLTDSGNYIPLVELTGKGMEFDMTTSGFYSCPSEFRNSTDPNYYACPTGETDKHRGWAETNLNIYSQLGVSRMESDVIHVQTIVSSRDYGWEESQ